MTAAIPRVHFVVPLDVQIIVQHDVAGFQASVSIRDRAATVWFPQLGDEVGSSLTSPMGFSYAGSAEWGEWSTHNRVTGEGQLLVSSLGFTIDLDVAESPISPEALPLGYVKGLEWLESGIAEWMSRFVEVGGILLGQPLSLFEPSPKILSRPHSNPLHWVEQDGFRSWLSSSMETGITVTIETSGNPRSERVADLEAVRRLVMLASKDPMDIPSAVSLVAAARLAAQRGRLRLSLMELGTAAEAAFTDALQLGSHIMTLGVLVDHVAARGLTLPLDVKDRFVKPRNAAVHKGQAPSLAEVDYGFALLDGLIWDYYTDFAYSSTAPLAWRPQRQDLVFARPPSLGESPGG